MDTENLELAEKCACGAPMTQLDKDRMGMCFNCAQKADKEMNAAPHFAIAEPTNLKDDLLAYSGDCSEFDDDEEDTKPCPYCFEQDDDAVSDGTTPCPSCGGRPDTPDLDEALAQMDRERLLRHDVNCALNSPPDYLNGTCDCGGQPVPCDCQKHSYTVAVVYAGTVNNEEWQQCVCSLCDRRSGIKSTRKRAVEAWNAQQADRTPLEDTKLAFDAIPACTDCGAVLPHSDPTLSIVVVANAWKRRAQHLEQILLDLDCIQNLGDLTYRVKDRVETLPEGCNNVWNHPDVINWSGACVRFSEYKKKYDQVGEPCEDPYNDLAAAGGLPEDDEQSDAGLDEDAHVHYLANLDYPDTEHDPEQDTDPEAPLSPERGQEGEGYGTCNCGTEGCCQCNPW